MLVELHILQNFAPSNLNRDDTGSPKDCEFGGYRRARISSQCLKRAIRRSFREDELLPAEHRGHRTKRLLEALRERLVTRGREVSAAEGVALAALGGLGLAVDDDGKCQYLLFLGEQEIEKLTDLCDENWAALAAAAGGEKGRLKAKDAKKAAKEAISPEVAKKFQAALDGGRAADLGMFGRMLADMPERNVDAASQVAHAISTNKVSTEFDFYTAVDDFNPEDNVGAGMMGTVEFNSACFYRYANIDVDQLKANLGGDATLTARALEAFLQASVRAIPTGKQNSMAAHNPPSLIFAVARESGACSLANAFLEPVAPTHDADLLTGSVKALDRYWNDLTRMYGDRGIRRKVLCTHVDDALDHLKGSAVPSVTALIDSVLEAVR